VRQVEELDYSTQLTRGKLHLPARGTSKFVILVRGGTVGLGVVDNEEQPAGADDDELLAT
jgi:hypothetical protein